MALAAGGTASAEAAASLRYARFEGHQIAFAPNSVTLSDHFTLEAWIFVERQGEFFSFLGKPSDPPSAAPYHSADLNLRPDGRVQFLVSGADPATMRGVTSPVAVPMRHWTHVAATLDGSSIRLYLDGQLAGSGTAASAPGGAAPLAIGAPFYDPRYGVPGGLSGAMRGVRVWKRALSAGEVLAARNGTAGSDGLVAWWPLEGSTEAELARDASLNGLTLQMGIAHGLDRWEPRPVAAFLLRQPPYRLEIQAITPHTGGLAYPILGDFDSDGYLDLLETHADAGPDGHMIAVNPRAFRNDRSGVFADASDEMLASPKAQVFLTLPDFACVADFNGDGRTDVFLGDSGPDEHPYPGGQSHLLIQDSGGRLVDQTGSRLPGIVAFTHGATKGDLDGDGDLDIVDAKNNKIGPRLYFNDGTGHFSDTTGTRLPSFITSTQRRFISVLAVDIDGDQDLDLVWGEFDLGSAAPGDLRDDRDVVLRNDGGGRFTTAPRTVLPPRRGGPEYGTLAIASFDFDRDGDADLLFAQQSRYRTSTLQLLQNDGQGHFTDASDRIAGNVWPDARAETPNGGAVYHLAVADLNHDSWPDFLCATAGSYPMRAYLSSGDARFYDASEILPNVGQGGLQPADLDGDGDVDLVAITGNGENVVAVGRNMWPYNARPSRRQAVRR